MGLNIFKKKLFDKLHSKYTKLITSINLKPVELDIDLDSKCLCLTPHADDESIGMGGLLSLYGENFDVVLLTDGRKGIKDLPIEEVIQKRENEFLSAMFIAGVKQYKFLRAQDKKLIDSYLLFKEMDLSKYDYIFLPNIIDQHPDHKAVSILLKQLLSSDVKMKKNLKICFYEVWSALGFVNAFVDISKNIDSKRNMIRCYESQIAQKDYEYYAQGINQYRGMFKDKKYVEAFCVMSVDEFLKVCELY